MTERNETPTEQMGGWVNPETGESVTVVIDVDAAIANMSAEELRGYIAAQRVIESRLRSTIATLTAERDMYRRALENHLCEYDMADWVACAGHGDATECDVCVSEGDHRHSRVATLTDQLQEARAERDEARDHNDYLTPRYQDAMDMLATLRTPSPDVEGIAEEIWQAVTAAGSNDILMDWPDADVEEYVKGQLRAILTRALSDPPKEDE